MTPRLPIFHLRRAMRLQAQEARRVQREAAAVQLAAMDEFAAHMQAQHQAFVRQLADQQHLLTEAEGPADELAALRKQLH